MHSECCSGWVCPYYLSVCLSVSQRLTSWMSNQAMKQSALSPHSTYTLAFNLKHKWKIQLLILVYPWSAFSARCTVQHQKLIEDWCLLMQIAHVGARTDSNTCTARTYMANFFSCLCWGLVHCYSYCMCITRLSGQTERQVTQHTLRVISIWCWHSVCLS